MLPSNGLQPARNGRSVLRETPTTRSTATAARCCVCPGRRRPGRRRRSSRHGFWPAKTTCSTPGSARPSGRIRRSAGREPTPELKYYYPTSVLITSRDIITLWVARMVLTGLNNVGEVPFRDVYIHPKILDGYGEGMSKSKGNGVDPIDVIEKFGADCAALRPGLPDDRNAGRADAGRVRVPALRAS